MTEMEEGVKSCGFYSGPEGELMGEVETWYLEGE
jgi:hypothetical protein